LKNFTFHSGDYSPTATYLFNDRKHLLLQAANGWKCFYILDHKQVCAAFIWLHITEGVAQSPFKAPFGSFELIDKLPPKILHEFLQFIQVELQKLSVQTIIIKNAPAVYEPNSHALLSVLLYNLSFIVSSAEISSVIPISTSSYTNLITEWENRKLKQAKNEFFSFHQKKASELTELYSFIESCRIEKGYTLSLSMAQLHELQHSFPAAITLFAVQQQHELAAACVCIRVSEKILYTFYYDHAAEFQQYSPVVLLIEGIYTYCQQNSITLLDLGTASLDGQPNFSLLDFKQHLGGQPSAKLTFTKTLA
jgi:hypothetical protein